MENQIKSITFFAPAKLVGGEQYLLVRLADYIAENYDIDVFYIEYLDGFARNLIKSDKVKFIDFYKNKKSNIDFDTYLITAASRMFRIYNQLNLSENVKLFFWVMHVYNFLYLFPFFLKNRSSNDLKNKIFLERFYKKEYSLMKKLVNDLSEKNALVFMDLTSYKSNEIYFGLKEKKYLPIPINEIENTSNYNLIDETIINIVYLGNLVDFKIYSILNLVQNADNYSGKYNKKVKIHIIGQGFEKYVIDEYKIKNNIEIIFKGILIEEELNDYLLNNIDILFAMGTSVLESAKLNLPSVIVNLSYVEIPLYNKFAWLFESQNFSLGSYISETKYYKHTFEDIINSVYVNKQKKEIGEKCYNYFQENHSMKTVCEKLFNYLNEASEINIEYLKKTGLYETKLQYFRVIRKCLSKVKDFLLKR